MRVKRDQDHEREREGTRKKNGESIDKLFKRNTNHCIAIYASYFNPNSEYEKKLR